MKIRNTEILLNCLAKDLDNAVEIFEASNGDALIGLLTKDFNSNEEYIKEAKKYNEKINNHLSVGLGGGDPKQSFMVTEVAKEVDALHINQVFTGVGATVAVKHNPKAIVNALISPTGTVGKVKISTGPNSSEAEEAIVPTETAFSMIKDMGGNSIKFFNMKGIDHIDEVQDVINNCAKFNFIFEPTGGIALEHVEEILTKSIEANIGKVIIHIYSSIIDKETGRTKIDLVDRFWEIVKTLK